MIRRANGTVDEIGEEIAGFPLGIIPEADYKQTEVKLYPGDVVAVFSDGVTDARNLREELYDSRDKRRLMRRARRDHRRARGGRPRTPAGHPRVLGRPHPGRRHHADLLRPVCLAQTHRCRSKSPTSAWSSTSPRKRLPRKLASRLGLPRRRRSATGGSSARASTPGRTTTSTSAMPPSSTSTEHEPRARRRGVAADLTPYVPERFDWPEPGPAPLAAPAR